VRVACEVLGKRQHSWEDVNARRCIPKADVHHRQDIISLAVDELFQVRFVVKLCDVLAGLDTISCLIGIV